MNRALWIVAIVLANIAVNMTLIALAVFVARGRSGPYSFAP